MWKGYGALAEQNDEEYQSVHSFRPILLSSASMWFYCSPGVVGIMI